MAGVFDVIYVHNKTQFTYRITLLRLERRVQSMKVRVTVNRPYGNIEFEGESLDEVVQTLEAFPEWLDVIDRLIPTTTEEEAQNILEGIVEMTSEGPQLVVAKDRISSKDAISLLLYAKDPEPMEPKGIGRLLSLSGHGSAGFGSRLSEMRREGMVLKEGQGYRLSSAGKMSVEELLQKLSLKGE